MKMLDTANGVRVPYSEFDFDFARSSGPGGQNVNKVNSKAVLRWDFENSPSVSPGVRQRFAEQFGSRINSEGQVVIASDRFRDQGKNVEDCLEKLREMLASVARPPKIRRPTKPTKGSQRRRVEGKRAHSEKKAGRRGSWD